MTEQGKARPVVVTGGADGIGRAIAERFARMGHPVGIVDLDGARARRTAAALGAEPSAWAEADVSDDAASAAAHGRIAEQIGPAAILINNAGIMPREVGRVEDLPPAQFDEMLAIHLRGALLWSRMVLPEMRKAGWGRIVNLASMLGMVAAPHRVGYVTAKTAIIGLTRALALETARAGITVNAVAPGYVLTAPLRAKVDAGVLGIDAIAERTPVGRWAAPSEIAEAVAFLAGPGAAYVTGATLPVDGGMSIRGDPGEDIGPRPCSPLPVPATAAPNHTGAGP